MTAATSRKGRDGENPVVTLLRATYWPHAERRAKRGTRDAGDITGTPGLAWEVRNRREIRLPSWLRTARKRADEAGADYGILVWKPDGMGEKTVADWPAIMRLGDLARLLQDAGYGEPL